MQRNRVQDVVLQRRRERRAVKQVGRDLGADQGEARVDECVHRPEGVVVQHRRGEQRLVVAVDALDDAERASEQVGAIAVLDDHRIELRARLDDVTGKRRVGWRQLRRIRARAAPPGASGQQAWGRPSRLQHHRGHEARALATAEDAVRAATPLDGPDVSEQGPRILSGRRVAGKDEYTSISD